MSISKQRQKEIIELATPGVPSDTPEELFKDDAVVDLLIRSADRKRREWLRAAADALELHFFAANWGWDNGIEHLLLLVDNPHCDAGTMLMLFWQGDVQSFYSQNGSADNYTSGPESDRHRLFRHIERRMVKKDYASSSIYFDPSPFVSRLDNSVGIVRLIPEVLCKPPD